MEIVCSGTQYSYCTQVLGQRQKVLFILQHYDRFTGCLTCHLFMAVRVPSRINLLPVQRFAGILFKEFITEHGRKHGTTYVVQIFHVDASVFGGLNHFFIVISITAISGNTGSQCLVSSFNFILCRIMFAGSQITDSTTVTDNKSVESPFLPQNLLQQFRTLGNRNTHIIGVSHHQRLTVIVTDSMTERNQVNFTHFTFRQTDVMRVTPTQWSTMSAKMLGSSK